MCELSEKMSFLRISMCLLLILLGTILSYPVDISVEDICFRIGFDHSRTD